MKLNNFKNDKVVILGRHSFENNELWIYNSATGIRIKVKTNKLSVVLKTKSKDYNMRNPFVSVVIDGDFENAQVFSTKDENLSFEVNMDGSCHVVEILKNNEAIDNYIGFVEISADEFFIPEKKKFSLLMGDSTTAGYGLLKLNTEESIKSSANSNGLRDFGFMALRRLGYDVSTFTASGWGVQASIWTNPKTIKVPEYIDKVCVLNDCDWDYKNEEFDYMIISLGTNDYYYIKEDPALIDKRRQEFVDSYLNLVNTYLARYPNMKIICCFGTIKEENIEPQSYNLINEELVKLASTNERVHVHHFDGDTLGVNGHPYIKKHYEMADDLVSYINGLK